MKIKTSGYLILVLALLFASSTPLAYVLGSTSNPIELAFLVSLVGTLSSFIIMLARRKQTHLAENLPEVRNMWSFAFVGASFAVQTLIFSYVTHYISASLLAVVYRSWPLMLILLAPIMLRERTTKYDILAVAVGFLGMAAALLANSTIGIPIMAFPFVGLVLLAAFIDAVTGVFQRSYKYEMTSTLFLYNFFSLIVVSAFLPLSGPTFSLNLGAGDIFAIFFLGIVQNVVLTFMFTSAIRLVKLPVVANATIIVPFMTIILDFFILREPIELSYLLIALSVFAGLLIQKFAPKTSNYVSKRKHSKRMPALYDVTSAFSNTKNKMIYDVIKENGRVLAFCKRISSPENLDAYMKIVSSTNSRNKKCTIITDGFNTTRIHPSELEFINEILGRQNGMILVLGIGKPDDVEASFEELHKADSE